MKILKYLFLLFLLAIFAASVFIATLKNTVYLEKSIFIKIPRDVVFEYVNHYENWELWASWKEDNSSLKFLFPETKSGKATSFSWSGADSRGKIITIKQIINQKIVMKTIFNNNIYQTTMNFKDSVGGTKLSWQVKGEIDFLTKVKSTLFGGIEKVVGNVYERSLNNLKTVLTKEINDYKFTVAGLVTIPARYYIKSTITCNSKNVQTQINSNLQKIALFFKEKNLSMNGKPFVIKEFEQNDSIKIGVYGPLQKQIFIPEINDLTTGLMPGFTAFKTILKGDYTHLKVSRKNAVLAFNNKGLKADQNMQPMEVYFRTISDTKKPSQWITFIQIPIYSKPAFVPKVYKPRIKTVDQPLPTTEMQTPVKEEF